MDDERGNVGAGAGGEGGRPLEEGGAGGEAEDAGIPDIDCDPVGTVTLFDCNVELCTPADIRTVTEQVDIEGFYADLREILSAWVDESCFERCEPTIPYQCVDDGRQEECKSATCMAGTCTTSRGYMKYSITDEYDDYETEGFSSSSEIIQEEIIIRPPPGEESFSEIVFSRVQRIEWYYGVWDETDFSISWVGLLRPDWPRDFSGWFYFANDQHDGGERVLKVRNAGCDLYYGDGFDWELAVDGQTLSVDCTYIQPIRCHADLNQQCLGEVDRDTFEIIGPCP